jgi:hypothetical protein
MLLNLLDSQPVLSISPIGAPCSRPTLTSPQLSSPSPHLKLSLFRRSLLFLSVSSISSLGLCPAPGVLGLAHVGTSAFPYLKGPGLVTTDRLGEMPVQINNCTPAELVLPKNLIIGFFEIVNSDTIQELENDIFVNAVNKVSSHFPPPLSVPNKNNF